MTYKIAPIAAAPVQLFSEVEIPPSPYVDYIRPGTHRWLSLDSEANYRKNPHPVLGPDSVTYSINRHGYRTTELQQAAEDGKGKVRIVCIGSSGAFGIGLPESDTFPVVFRDLLQDHIGREAIVWNLSLGGTGADYVTRMLFSTIPALRPHVLLLTCFPFNRREFIGEEGRIFPSYAVPHWHQRLSDPEHWYYDDACRRICNPYTDLINMVTNIKVWESLCDDARVPWLYMTEAYSVQHEPIEFLLREPRKMVRPGVHALIDSHCQNPATGLARDMLHAGVQPNLAIAEAMFARFLELYPSEIAAHKSRGRE